MKRNTMIAAGTALVLALFTHTSQAQNDAPATQPTPATPPAVAPAQPVAPGPGQRPMPMPPRPRQPRFAVQAALRDLQQVKATLQNSQDDFGGHRDSALAACDKAVEELTAVMKAMPAPTPPPQRAGARPPAGAFPGGAVVGGGAVAPGGTNAPPAAPNQAPPPQP
jgi:hypothetical protein